MRIAKLIKIKSLLDPILARKGHFIYLAPLLSEHYNRYIQLIHANYGTTDSLVNILTNEDILRETSAIIDVRTDILVNTNLYVSRISTNDLDLHNELIEFVTKEGINYRFLIADDELIRELENKPEKEINE